MQEDMHYYGIYALARAAGLYPEIARTIAHASQFVDDATEDGAIPIDDDTMAILPTTTSHQALDFKNAIAGDQWKVWVPFHFLCRGGDGSTPFEQRAVCEKNCPMAKDVLKHAMDCADEKMRPYVTGISLHAFADTFSHHGFVGLSTKLNKVEESSVKIDTKSKSILKYLGRKFQAFMARIAGTLAETVPVGHGSVATFPDRPYLVWEFKYEENPAVKKVQKRDNPKEYIEAWNLIHGFLTDYLKKYPAEGDPSTASDWKDIEPKIEKIIRHEGTMKERIGVWWEAILNSALFPTQDEDMIAYYDEKAWKGSHVDLAQEEVGLFHKAAWIHRELVIHKLMPKYNVLVTP